MFRLFSYLTTFFSVSALLALCALITLILPKSDAWELSETNKIDTKLPEFFADTFPVENLGKGALHLDWIEPKTQLPNLSQTLQFYGVSSRPDLCTESLFINLALSGNEEIELFDIRHPIYLTYASAAIETQQTPPSLDSRVYHPTSYETPPGGHYAFSPQNSPTPLWLEIDSASLKHSSHKQCHFKVKMRDEEGLVVDTPTENLTVILSAREVPKSLLIGWSLGGFRADATLLLRQKARWIGQDQFLKLHGGEAFAHTVGCERIDFLTAEKPYSLFLKEGAWLVWDGLKWVDYKDSDSPTLSPLLEVKKIEENLIYFQLWDPEGKGSFQINLVRSKDVSALPNIEEEFKFIGAKTWSKFIVESRDERMTLKAHDWLVLTQDMGWTALDSEELIQNYLDGKLQGPLLVIEKLIKTQGGQTLLGHLFSTSRTSVIPISLLATSKGAIGTSSYLPPIKEERN